MPVIDIRNDPDALTMTVVSEFDAPPERVWQLWADPRQLERWWGPPGYPATFLRHDFSPRGRSVYCMTSPAGERHYGWWAYESVAPPRAIEFLDGFGDERGNPAPGAPEPTPSAVTIEPAGAATRVTIATRFSSPEQFDALVEMGIEDGYRESLEQIDGILAAER